MQGRERKLTDVRAVLVRDPEAAVGAEHEALVIERNARAARLAVGAAAVAETVAGEVGDGQRDGVARVRDLARAVGVQAGAGPAVGARQQDGVEVVEVEIGARRVRRRGVGRQRELDAPLV